MDTQDIIKNKDGHMLHALTHTIPTVRPARSGKTDQWVTLAGLPIDPDTEPYHFLISGDTRIWQTEAIMNLLAQLDHRGDRAIIVDPDGRFERQFGREGDVRIDPTDPRAVAWSPFAEMTRDADAAVLARWMLQDTGAECHEVDRRYAAREVLTLVLKSLYQANATNQDLSRALSAIDLDQNRVLQPSLNTLTQELRDEIHAELGALRAWLDMLPPDVGRRAWSLRRWAEAGAGWLWIPRAEPVTPARQLIPIWVSVLAHTAIAEQMATRLRTWMIAGDIADIGSGALAQSLSYPQGLCVVATMRSITRLHAIHGHYAANRLLGAFHHHMVMRAEDPDLAAWAAETLSRHSTSDEAPPRPLLGPNDIATLPEGAMYLRLAGDVRIVPVDLRVVRGAASTHRG